jgi:hypothetical protein
MHLSLSGYQSGPTRVASVRNHETMTVGSGGYASLIFRVPIGPHPGSDREQKHEAETIILFAATEPVKLVPAASCGARRANRTLRHSFLCDRRCACEFHLDLQNISASFPTLGSSIECLSAEIKHPMRLIQTFRVLELRFRFGSLGDLARLLCCRFARFVHCVRCLGTHLI